jgi:hypothetical protein
MKLTFCGEVKNGTLHIKDRKQFEQDVKVFEGKIVMIEISRYVKHRSQNQNKYYWSTIVPYVRHGFIEIGEIGVTNDEIHTFLKDRFLDNGKEVVIPTTGETIKLGKTTTSLSTVDFMTYVAQIQKFAAEMLGVVIPDPTPIFSYE